MQNVSVRRLAVFCAVARYESFIAAAEALGITQPSVSDHIRLLERSLGVSLFERHRGRAPQLTDAGRALLTHSQALLNGLHTVRSDSGASATAKSVIRFACHRPVATAVLPDTLAQFASNYPGVELSMQAGTSDEVIKKVRTGSADIGMYLGLSAPTSSKFDAVNAGHEVFELVVGINHPLARKGKIAVADLIQCPFIRSDHTSRYAQDVTVMLSKVGLQSTRIASRVTEFNTARALALQGVGVWCTLRRGVQNDLDNGTLTALKVDIPSLQMPLWLLSRPTDNEVVAQFKLFLQMKPRPPLS